MIKDRYEELLKAERDRIKGTSFIPSYGKMPVHNEKFNKLIQYLEKVNKDLQVENPTENQINIQNLIQKQLDMARLDVLLKNLENFREKKGNPSMMEKMLFASSFRSWCGAGTDIYKNIQKDYDDPNSMFKIDTICRDHDIRYTKAKTIEDLKEADNIMVFEIIEKYVVNFNKNFITGKYKSDFSSVSESFNTLYNYIVSIIEGGVNMFMMYESLKNIGGNIKSIAKFGLNNLVYGIGQIALNMNNAGEIVDAGFNQQDLDDLQFKGLIDFFTDVPKIGKTVGAYYFGSMIRDRIFSMGALIGIVYKTVIEELFDIEIISPTKHDITDEELENVKQVFEQLQNQYLQESGLDPIKIGNEFTKEELIIPSIPTLEKELSEIFIMNKTYIEKRQEVIENEPEKIIVKPSLEQLDEPDELDELMNEINEMFNIIVVKDMEQFQVKAKDEIKQMSQDLDDKINSVPDIPQDIKKSTQQNIFTMPEPEMVQTNQKSNVNQLGDEINKYREIYKDEL